MFQQTWRAINNDPAELVELIKAGQIGVLPTDTIYGLVGSALNQDVVEKIFRLKDRSPQKPLIVLISSVDDLKIFNIILKSQDLELINQLWPNPVSIVLPLSDQKWPYLDRGTHSLALRIPKDPNLRQLLHQTGPLVAPSANPESQLPAQTIDQAHQYFQDTIDFYIDAGQLKSLPSTLVSINNGHINLLRPGAYQIPHNLVK